MEFTGGRLAKNNPSDLQSSNQHSHSSDLSPQRPSANPRPPSLSFVPTAHYQNRARRNHVENLDNELQQLATLAGRPPVQTRGFSDAATRRAERATTSNELTSSTNVNESATHHNHGNVLDRQSAAITASSTTSEVPASVRRSFQAASPNNTQQAAICTQPQVVVHRTPGVNNEMSTYAPNVGPVDQQIPMCVSQAQRAHVAVRAQLQPPQPLPSIAAAVKGIGHAHSPRVVTRSNAPAISLTRRPLLAPRTHATGSSDPLAAQQPPSTPTYHTVAEQALHANDGVETVLESTQGSSAAELAGQRSGLQMFQQGRDVLEIAASLTEYAITTSSHQLHHSDTGSDSETVIYDAVNRDEGQASPDRQVLGSRPSFAVGLESLHGLISLSQHTSTTSNTAQLQQQHQQHGQQAVGHDREYQQTQWNPHNSEMLYSYGRDSLQPPWLLPQYNQCEEDIASNEEEQTQDYSMDAYHDQDSQQNAVRNRHLTQFEMSDDLQLSTPSTYSAAAGRLGPSLGRQQRWRQDVQYFARDGTDTEDGVGCDDDHEPCEGQTNAADVGVVQEYSRESPVYPGAQIAAGRPQQLTRPLVVQVRRRTQDDDYHSWSDEDAANSTDSDDESQNGSDGDNPQAEPDVENVCRYSFDAALQAMPVSDGLRLSHPVDRGTEYLPRNSSLRPLLERLGINHTTNANQSPTTHIAQDVSVRPCRSHQTGLQDEPNESVSPTLGRVIRSLPPLATHIPGHSYGTQRRGFAESPRTPRVDDRPAGDISPIHHWMSDHAAQLLLPHNMRGMADLFTSDMLWSTRRGAAVLGDDMGGLHGEAGSVNGRHIAASCPVSLSHQEKVFGHAARAMAGYHVAKDACVLDVFSSNQPKPGVKQLLCNETFIKQLLCALPGVNPDHSSIKSMLLILSGELPPSTSLDMLPGQVPD